ncbi:group 1 glycosyl transferase [Streptomyces sparsogenes DSM 40356]|uniref:D-inositol 3-phosphate glycosyltransferase n=1 Tax=Streptomyces sparsogenes DSM 40356 TaxID=1331668 RepID=A0A1R1SG64_9ACTN|nr:group 1 glycosyl transferase [Streptomyces sparsogenes DSM 40356]
MWRALDPQPLLVIAGEGAGRAALQRRIDAEELPVRLLGRREDVPALLAAADVAVLSSRWEARSLLAQEALHAGVPLVATAVGGCRSWWGRRRSWCRTGSRRPWRAR